ncbi:MAG: rhodanese-like domain-containing protein [Candidatus Woesearchaeota archaeon]
MKKSITTDELKELIYSNDNKSQLYLIDVREKDELVYGIIPTAKHIPLAQLDESLHMTEQEFEKKYHFKKFRKNNLIVVYCRSGGRSAVARSIMQKNGYNALNYTGSILAWSKIDPNVTAY